MLFRGSKTEELAMTVRFKSIRTKLLLLFLVFNVIPMGFVASHVYRHAEISLRASTLEHLEEIAKLKSLEITRFFDLARLHLISAQDFVNFRTNIPVLLRMADRKSDPRFIAAKRMLDIQVIKFASDHNVKDIDIIGLDGAIAYSTDSDHGEHESRTGLTYFDKGKKGIYFSDIYRKEGPSPHYFIIASAPLHDLGNMLIGVIVFEISADPFFSMLQDTTGMGNTGETLIGKRINDSVMFLNPLRHDPDAALKVVKTSRSSALPLVRAASGDTGSGISTDYRGTEVVAAWRYIPSLDWGIVTKIDSAEAFAAARELRTDMLTAGAIALSLGVFISLGLANSMTRPIRELKLGAEQLGKGNLDHRVTVSSGDEIGSLSKTFNHMAANLKEITESRDQIRHQANHDPLTGLPNRLLLEDRLEQALFEAKREHEILAVMFLDLDGFKLVNDTYGHDVGDFLLKQVAFRLLKSVRQRDTVARLGGDEFVIILHKISDIANIPFIATKFLNAFSEDFLIDGHTIHIGTSIGISLYPRDGDTPDLLMQLSDEAMYAAKKNGKNTYRQAN
jgi:diguanylate cyclase (GGDEF)-like protein